MFKFRYSVKPENLWVLTMVNIYRSFPAVINLVFTVSMILLAVRFWIGSETGIKILIAAGILLFPVFQPLLIFLRCRRIVGRMPRDMEITIDESGITTEVNGNSSHISYREVRSVTRVFDLMIIQTHMKQGFILSKRIIDVRNSGLYNFISSQVSRE